MRNKKIMLNKKHTVSAFVADTVRFFSIFISFVL